MPDRPTIDDSAEAGRALLAVARMLDGVAAAIGDAATDYDAEPDGIVMHRDSLMLLDGARVELDRAIMRLTQVAPLLEGGGHVELLLRDLVSDPLEEMRDAFARRGDGYSRHRAIDRCRGLATCAAESIAESLRIVASQVD